MDVADLRAKLIAAAAHHADCSMEEGDADDSRHHAEAAHSLSWSISLLDDGVVDPGVYPSIQACELLRVLCVNVALERMAEWSGLSLETVEAARDELRELTA